MFQVPSIRASRGHNTVKQKRKDTETGASEERAVPRLWLRTVRGALSRAFHIAKLVSEDSGEHVCTAAPSDYLFCIEQQDVWTGVWPVTVYRDFTARQTQGLLPAEEVGWLSPQMLHQPKQHW